MLKINELLKKDFKIVENRRYFFVVPVIILVIALIFMAVSVFGTGEANRAFNFSMDFTGGYGMTVKLGERIQSDSVDSLKQDVLDGFGEVVDGNGNKVFDTSKISITTQSEGADKAFVVEYQVPVGRTETEMEKYNESAKEILTKKLLVVEPVVTLNGNEAQVVYDGLKTFDIASVLAQKLENAGYSATVVGDYTVVDGVVTYKFDLTGSDALNASDITEVLTIDNKYSGEINLTGKVGASMSSSLVSSAVIAVVIALVVMLAYIAIRFHSLGFSAALATIIALMHDVLMMFCFMAIFRVELGASFIAGLVTILGYSVNNTIVIFDRVRENKLFYKNKMTPAEISNKSVKETLWRSVNTTFTTLATIGCLAIFCVTDVQIFALPIIAGLIAGAYSSMLIAPSVWAAIQQAKLDGAKKALKNKKKRA